MSIPLASRGGRGLRGRDDERRVGVGAFARQGARDGSGGDLKAVVRLGGFGVAFSLGALLRAGGDCGARGADQGGIVWHRFSSVC